MAFELTDSKDGYNIRIFERRGQIVAYKVNELGRFLRRVYTIRVELTSTVEYKGIKKNDIYVDAKMITKISPKDLYENWKNLDDRLEHEFLEKMTELFGSVITEMLTVVGFEFFEESDKPEFPKIDYVILWKHHYTDNWREKRLEEIL